MALILYQGNGDTGVPTDDATNTPVLVGKKFVGLVSSMIPSFQRTASYRHRLSLVLFCFVLLGQSRSDLVSQNFTVIVFSDFNLLTTSCVCVCVY